MRGLFLALTFSYCLLLGWAMPFAAALTYIWTDIVKPQDLAYSIINGVSLSLIAAVCSFGFYFLNDRKHPPKFTIVLSLLCAFAIWITISTGLSIPELQTYAWQKWNWAFNVLVFTIFIPFIFRSRVQIEAMVLVIIFSASTIFFTAGIKTALGGGGYGVLAVMGSGNAGLSESSTLSAVCLMLIPLMHFALRHSIILPRNQFFKLLFPGLIVLALLTIVGSNARTGLIAGFVLFVRYALRSKKKMLWVMILLALGVGYQVAGVSSSDWGSRMSTINTYKADSSALGRVEVWKWTLDFVKDHPLGGGFDAYRLNRIAVVTEEGTTYFQPGIINGKAFHSIYFEILGEQGYLGFFIYFFIIGITWMKLHKLHKTHVVNRDLDWACALSLHLRDALIVFLIAGAFIGIAYQPYVFYLIGLGICLDQYLVRYLNQSAG